jgi:hypothetical protein
MPCHSPLLYMVVCWTRVQQTNGIEYPRGYGYFCLCGTRGTCWTRIAFLWESVQLSNASNT